MSSDKFNELSREEKEELAERRMQEMRLKNQRILERHAEVENDRINAESKNSAVTSAQLSSGSSQRRRNVTTQNNLNEESTTARIRAWDRGKPNPGDWNKPEPARINQKHQYRNSRESSRYDRKNFEKTENRNFRKESSEYSHHDRRAKGEFNEDEQLSRGGWQNPPLKAPYKSYYKGGTQEDSVDDWNTEKRNSYKAYSKKDKEFAPDRRISQENWQTKPDRSHHNASRFQVSPRRTRGTVYRNNSHRKYQSYPDDKCKKPDFKQSNSRKNDSHKDHSRSSSKSESDHMENQFTLRSCNLWQNDKSNDDRSKEKRTEKWVKAVNESNERNENQLSSEEKDVYSNKFYFDKQESPRKSFTKFDRIRLSSEKDSDDDSIILKSSEDMKMSDKDCVRPQYNYEQKSSLISGSSVNSKFIKKTEQPNNKQNSYEDNGQSYHSEFVKKTVGHHKTGFQSKHSPPFKAGESSDYVKNKYKSKSRNNTFSNDKWKNSRNEMAVNKKNDIVDEWNSAAADGMWGEAEQSNIKWNLSDEEDNFNQIKQNTYKQKSKSQADSDDSLDPYLPPKRNALPGVRDSDNVTTTLSGSTNIRQQKAVKVEHVASEAPGFLLEEKHGDDSTHEHVPSDDGGWSTFSEEGEIA